MTIPIVEKTEQFTEGLMGFYPSYRSVNWLQLLPLAQKEITIVVYYWDQWTLEHQQVLLDFLQKPDAKLRFFFADDSMPPVLSEIQRLFPHHSHARLQEKIRHTYQSLKLALSDLRLAENKIEIYKVPHLLNYSLQCIDDKVLILSFFEMYRNPQVDSPAIVVDLQQSPHLKTFYTKELHEMKAHAKAYG